MPIREFLCRDCGHVYEELVSQNAIETEPCPQCESTKTEKLISAHGGHQGNFGTVRQKGAGSYKRVKK